MSRDVLARRPWLRRRCYALAATFSAHCPLWAARTLAWFVALAWYLGDRRGRETVARNLAAFIPAGCPEARRRAVRRSFRDFAFAVAETFALPRLRARRLADRVEVIDPWGVFARRPISGPTVLATVHCNWEQGAGLLHHLGLTAGVEVVALSTGDAAVDAVFERLRAGVGCRSLLLDRAPLASLRALKAGKVLGLVCDRDYTGGGMSVRFGGRRLAFPVGPAALAVQCGAQIVPCLFARRGASRFAIVIGRPLRAVSDLGKAAQVAVLTQRLADTCSRFLAAVPAQWVAFHEMWPESGTTSSARLLAIRPEKS